MLSAYFPDTDHPAHKMLQRFMNDGVMQTPYDLSIFRGQGVDKTTDWISIHRCDLARLKLIGQEIGQSGAGYGR